MVNANEKTKSHLVPTLSSCVKLLGSIPDDITETSDFVKILNELKTNVQDLLDGLGDA